MSVTLSKGPGAVHDCLDETGSRVYHAVQFCQTAQHAKDYLAVARCESGPLADRLRALARSYGQRARGYYEAMMGREGAV